MSRDGRSHPPRRDHPWFNRPKTWGPGFLANQTRRTISDELRDMELSKAIVKDGLRPGSYDNDGSLRGARDPSYAPLSDGAGMRKPVRYD